MPEAYWSKEIFERAHELFRAKFSEQSTLPKNYCLIGSQKITDDFSAVNETVQKADVSSNI